MQLSALASVAYTRVLTRTQQGLRCSALGVVVFKYLAVVLGYSVKGLARAYHPCRGYRTQYTAQHSFTLR